MKRSEINGLIRDAEACFVRHGWALPPNPRWDVTDFGLGAWRRYGLVLVNLADEPEYCEKLMYAKQGMTTPAHAHKQKKEDIICRAGRLSIQVWPGLPEETEGAHLELKVNGEPCSFVGGDFLVLGPGERITLVPGVYHEFAPASTECVIGEVSTANDDLNDNFFTNSDIGRYPGIEEDEPAAVRLVSDK